MASISIHLMAEQDLDAADEVVKAAYPLQQSRKHTLQRYLALQPDGTFVAKQKDTIVGFAAAMNYGSFAYIGLMSVHPAMQKQGVGRQLLEYILAWLDKCGCPTVLLDATPAGMPLYERYGFVEDDETVVLQCSQPSPTPNSLPENVSVLREEDLPMLMVFDASLFGNERTCVLTSYRADDPQRALVTYNAQGHITGYLIAQAGVLGPWAASCVEDAERLLIYALTLPFRDKLSVFVSASHDEALRMFARYGFSHQRVLSHMRRGDIVQRGRYTALYGQATLGLG